jgi:putative heme-binding domain-containing protein
VEAGQQTKLAFTAPEEVGDYPYICTYPGHWRLMRGTLAVVKDVEEYLANRAATAPTITEWKVDDLKADLAAVSSGRNLARGRELYTKLACASCHKLGGEGVNYGPDLSDLLKRVNNDRAEVLRHILEPSLVISNRYRNISFNLKDGEEATGIILKEDAVGVTIQSGPSDSLIQTIAKSNIADRIPKDLSPMPMGLLNPLSKEDILDLLAWIESGGNAAHGHQH